MSIGLEEYSRYCVNLSFSPLESAVPLVLVSVRRVASVVPSRFLECAVFEEHEMACGSGADAQKRFPPRRLLLPHQVAIEWVLTVD